MILTLWLSLLALSVAVIILGYITGDEPYLPVGLFFFFILAIIVLTGSLEYQTGQVANTTFSYNGSVLESQSEVTAFSYTAWDDTAAHRVGWGLAVISFLGLALAMWNVTRGRKTL